MVRCPLFIIMLAYPLLRYMITSPFKIGVLLLGSLALNLFFPTGIELLCLSNVAYMLIFFCAGILFCRFGWQHYFAGTPALVVWILLFVGLTLVPHCPKLLLNLSGIGFSVALALNLEPVAPRLFSSFRDYTFQIFLLGIFPQIAIRILYAHLPHHELIYWGLYLASIVVGVYLPVLIARVIQRFPSTLVRRCFGL